MSTFHPLLLCIPMLLTALACGGQNAKPADAPKPAETTQDVPVDGFDPAAIKEGAEAVPPMYDPAVTEGEPREVVAMPGPLAHGRLEAPALAKIVVVEGGQPLEIAKDIPMRIVVDSGKSDRGNEILASLSTPEPKADGGFLYFTASTGGKPPEVPPAPALSVQAASDDKGNWHYGMMETPTQVGLFNILDLAGKKSIVIFPPEIEAPESTPVDMFDAMIDPQGMAILTAAGNLPDGRRLVITAQSTEPVSAQKAIADETATTAETPDPSTTSDGGVTKSE